jgi:hypothetical protein
LILSLLMLISSCRATDPAASTSPQSLSSSTTPAQSALAIISEDGFLPGEVLADLPVYPGATPTTFLNPGYGPPSPPLSCAGFYAGPLRPGYRSASAQYAVQAPEGDILSWYENELGRKGYRKSDESVWRTMTISGRRMAFFLPSQPLVSVEVHVYYVPSAMPAARVFEILVTYSVPLPKPPEEPLPSDIDSVKVTYLDCKVKTLTNRQDIMQLVNMVNALPVRPDYEILCPSGGPQTVFRLVFHSPSKGDITVTSILGGEEGGVNIDDYPILWDTHNLLREAVEQLLGEPGSVTITGPLTSSLSTTPSQSATTVTSGSIFQPGEVLAGLPVYPGATPTTFLNLDSGPPSLPAALYGYGLRRPGYESASAQYTVQATDSDILNWYTEKLETEGYRKYAGHSYGGGGTTKAGDIAFFLPSQPLVSVEIHVYDVPGNPVFELLVTYTLPLPKPDEEVLPSDTDSVEITYFGYSEDDLPRIKTLTDKRDVMQLVNMVNALPVRPDYVYMGSPMSGGPQTIFSLVFHSPSKGNITVSDIVGQGRTGIGIHISGFPILEDTYGLLLETIEQLLGVQSTYPAK